MKNIFICVLLFRDHTDALSNEGNYCKHVTALEGEKKTEVNALWYKSSQKCKICIFNKLSGLCYFHKDMYSICDFVTIVMISFEFNYTYTLI